MEHVLYIYTSISFILTSFIVQFIMAVQFYLFNTLFVILVQLYCIATSFFKDTSTLRFVEGYYYTSSTLTITTQFKLLSVTFAICLGGAKESKWGWVVQERFRTSSTPCYMVALTVVTYCDFVDTYFSRRSVLIADKVGFLLIYDFITIILLSGK